MAAPRFLPNDTVRRLIAASKTQSGAFDLPSIITGVVVVGILASGVLAAIFGVIPFAQDQGTQQDLSSVNNAQGVHKAQQGRFTSKSGLESERLTGGLPSGLTITAEDGGTGYCATAKSASGKTFAIAAERTEPWQGNCSFALNWKNSSAQNWQSVALSTDGQTMLAARHDSMDLFVSTNGGSTWTQRLTGATKAWSLPVLKVSADGRTMMAGMLADRLYTSTDAGTTWTRHPMNPGHHWQELGMSKDGRTMIAGSSIGLWTSTDSGASWTSRLNPSVYGAVAVSADGKTMVAGQNSSYAGHGLYTSRDGGTTWTGPVVGKWSSATVSHDGRYMTAGQTNTADSSFFTSRDYGETWQKAAIGTGNFDSSAASDDGQYIITAPSEGYVYTSSDGASTWKQQTTLGSRSWAWTPFAISADGRTMQAGLADAFFTSLDGGATWKDQTVALGQAGWKGMFVSPNGKVAATTNFNDRSLWIASSGRYEIG